MRCKLRPIGITATIHPMNCFFTPGHTALFCQCYALSGYLIAKNIQALCTDCNFSRTSISNSSHPVYTSIDIQTDKARHDYAPQN